MDALTFNEIKLIRGRYMDKWDSGPPYKGTEAYMAVIDFTEAELARVRLILRKIESESCIAGSDSGNTAVHALALEGLTIPI